ncbi:MAG TPA: hypothetical protein VNM67_20135 [Thermoanaerobaculia bacterium]|jgi:hypothetical protein|nr:hypothetical protein [Thermoanaerobaculia bacterium]
MRKTFILAIAFMAVASLSSAQERSLRFEKTVDYQLGKLIELNTTVGPVRITKVEFSQPEGASVKESIVGRIRGGSGGSSETQGTFRASFDTENPEEDEWVVTYTLDLLDSKGKLIDRIVQSEGLEGEAKVVNIDHSTLKYVLPFVDKVKIRLEAKYD